MIKLMHKIKLMHNKHSYISATAAILLCSFTAYAPVSPGQATPSDSRPTPINISQSEVIPGWEKFEADSIEIWLPESYDGGNLDEDIDVVVSNMRQLGPDFEQMVRLVEQNRGSYALWVFDSNLGPSNFLTNVAIGSEQVVSALTIETYLDATENLLPPQFQVVGRDIVALERYQAGQLILESLVNGVASKQIMYIVKEANTIWVIAYSTSLEEFDQRLPSFRQSMDTFQIRS